MTQNVLELLKRVVVRSPCLRHDVGFSAGIGWHRDLLFIACDVETATKKSSGSRRALGEQVGSQMLFTSGSLSLDGKNDLGVTGRREYRMQMRELTV